jgi:hypothetical protein
LPAVEIQIIKKEMGLPTHKPKREIKIKNNNQESRTCEK